MMTEIAVKKGQEYELEIESLAYGGKGISRINDFVIFVKNAIPGQKVRALVYRKRKGYAEARPLEIINESQHLVDAPCSHFLTCGGCKVQQLAYDEQIEQKKLFYLEFLYCTSKQNHSCIGSTLFSIIAFLLVLPPSFEILRAS